MSAEFDTIQVPSPAAGRFRIFKRGEWKKAFKLEGIFWTILEDCARRRSIKLADLVRQLTGRQDGVNDTSTLRVAAAEWLAAENTSLRGLCSLEQLTRVPLAAPVPVFIISRERRLIGFNPEFEQFIKMRVAASQPQAVSDIRLSLDAPVSKLLELFRESPGKAIACGFTIRAHESVATGRARVVMGKAFDQECVIGYVVT